MKAFPMFLRTTGRRVIILGGGEQAAQKARLILKTDARIVIAAPNLDAELAGLVRQGRAEHHTGPITPELFRDSALTFVATGCAGADTALHALAKEGGAVVNVVDRPDLCDATTPSIVDRDPVVVAIGTEGTAPVLARMVKTDVEAMLPPGLGRFAALAGRLRGAVAANIPQPARRAFWRWAFTGRPAQLHHQGAENEAAEALKAAIEARSVPKGAGEGHIALVGAGPGARDLLTLRAVERLQEADVIFYDRLVDEDVLELARRDAERVYVGKEVGASAWPQDRISALIVSEARQGRRVVRLKSGDPAIFGRAMEEMSEARSAGIPCEIVPGITAASAAAAATAQCLTERGETDTVVLSTGRCRPGDASPDWAHHARPGTTLALYMAVEAAPLIRTTLIRQGGDPDCRVTVVSQASRETQQVLETSLDQLPETLRAANITGEAMITIRWPKSTHASNLTIAAE